VIIDFHTHAYPRRIRESRDKYFPEEPAFKLLYESPKSKLVSAGEIVRVMDQQGVDRSVVFGFPFQSAALCRRNNDYILDAVARFPQRLSGFCCIDPFTPKAAAEAERCLLAGLRGVGELAFYRSGIDSDCLNHLEPIMALARAHDVPVMIHTNEPIGHLYPGKTPNTLSQIYRMVLRFAANKIVLAHWGGGLFFYNLLRKEVKESLGNVYFDTAASPFLYDADIYASARHILGVDKILFGTDYPLLKPERYFKEMEMAGLTRIEMDAICGRNAAELLKLQIKS
jgi:predicted TIM-barrel fold metal-dependent hydrolase